MAVYQNRSREIAERLIKLRDYLYVNATPTHAVKAKDMLAYLESEGHEIEIKTLYSDLETLRLFLNTEVTYDKHQKGYILANPDFEPYELRTIVNSIQAAKFITQQEADRLTSKIMGLADKYTRPSLKRQTFIPNRVRAINHEAMKSLDAIYEAIAKNRKISYMYFTYAFNNHTVFKEYHTKSGRKIITASPFRVIWQDNKYLIYTVEKVPKDIWFEDFEHEDGECVEDYIFPNMDDTGLYIYDLSILDLDRIEQVKVLAEQQEGVSIIQDCLGDNNNEEQDFSEKIKLKVNNMYISDIVTKFGDRVSISPGGYTFFIATIHEELTPELYMWTREFAPPIEIIYPENAEANLKSFFLRLSKDNDPTVQASCSVSLALVQ